MANSTACRAGYRDKGNRQESKANDHQ